MRRELRKKKRIYDLYKKGCATQKDYNDVVRLCREKVIEGPKPNWILIWLLLSKTKTVFINTQTNKEGLRRIFILYWM